MGYNHLNAGGGYVPRDGLPYLKVGDQFDINTYNKLVEGINRATIVNGNGYQVRRYSNSTVIQPNQYVTGGAFRNFQVYAYVDSNGQGFATVSVGTVNRSIPKINGIYIDQLDSNKLPPKISVNDEGYIVIEATYDAQKPFPSQVEIKFITKQVYDAGIISPNGNTSYYPLSSVKYVVANQATGQPASVLSTQLHSSNNLSVARIKVGQNTLYWQWWTV